MSELDYTRAAVAAIRRAVEAEQDFAGWLAGVLATVAAHQERGSHALTAGRPGSWEADHLRRLLDGTVGEDGSMLGYYASQPGGPNENLW